VCGKSLTVYFDDLPTMANISITLYISNFDVSRILFMSSFRNSDFLSTPETKFGAGYGQSYACNRIFQFKHGFDKLTISNVVFEAQLPFNATSWSPASA
jgi:hypothetical protein